MGNYGSIGKKYDVKLFFSAVEKIANWEPDGDELIHTLGSRIDYTREVVQAG